MRVCAAAETFMTSNSGSGGDDDGDDGCGGCGSGSGGGCGDGGRCGDGDDDDDDEQDFGCGRRRRASQSRRRQIETDALNRSRWIVNRAIRSPASLRSLVVRRLSRLSAARRRAATSIAALKMLQASRATTTMRALFALKDVNFGICSSFAKVVCLPTRQSNLNLLVASRIFYWCKTCKCKHNKCAR